MVNIFSTSAVTESTALELVSKLTLYQPVLNGTQCYKCTFVFLLGGEVHALEANCDLPLMSQFPLLVLSLIHIYEALQLLLYCNTGTQKNGSQFEKNVDFNMLKTQKMPPKKFLAPLLIDAFVFALLTFKDLIQS